jgi:hypothetical protein
MFTIHGSKLMVPISRGNLFFHLAFVPLRIGPAYLTSSAKLRYSLERTVIGRRVRSGGLGRMSESQDQMAQRAYAEKE